MSWEKTYLMEKSMKKNIIVASVKLCAYFVVMFSFL